MNDDFVNDVNGDEIGIEISIVLHGTILPMMLRRMVAGRTIYGCAVGVISWVILRLIIACSL